MITGFFGSTGGVGATGFIGTSRALTSELNANQMVPLLWEAMSKLISGFVTLPMIAPYQAFGEVGVSHSAVSNFEPLAFSAFELSA